MLTNMSLVGVNVSHQSSNSLIFLFMTYADYFIYYQYKLLDDQENKPIQRIYVPRQDVLRNKESSENVKFIGGFIHARYMLSPYVESINA